MPADQYVAEEALKPLKAFQRLTVDYVFERLFGKHDPTRQFLVADEVGLGKTMVARGVIARTIEQLWASTDRIDILYICSNQAIAAQNLRRLNVLGRQELALPTRMTLIPLQTRRKREGADDEEFSLHKNKVNFISLTPGTTFELRSSTGVVDERALLYRLLEDFFPKPIRLKNFLQVAAGDCGWDSTIENLDLDGIDESIINRFHNDVRSDRTLWEELHKVVDRFVRRREYYPDDMTQPRNNLIARLRSKLSYACVDALQPDLIILDEFQRFPDLLHGDSDAALLARELFEYSDERGNAARTLLLSATPYRMLTLSDDQQDEGDHHEDFFETLGFLYGRQKGPQICETLKKEMRDFRAFLHALPGSHAAAVKSRSAIETNLRQVIARTERISSTVARDAMMAEIPMSISIQPGDLHQAVTASEIARILDAPEIIEYWKSSPYLLNFMRDYALKRALLDNLEAPSASLVAAVRRALPGLLNLRRIDGYEPLDPGNGRMRSLMDEVFRDKLDQKLWIPPSLPYYGSPTQGPPPTKALLFSSWSMVPDAIAALLSYEAERRMGVGAAGQRYFEKTRPRPLQFRKDRGRLSGMRAMLLVYPSPTLARIADPLAIYAEQSDLLTLSAMRDELSTRLKTAFLKLEQKASGDDDGRGWEWAAPVALDSIMGSRAIDWLNADDGFCGMATEDAFIDHVEELRRAAKPGEFGSVAKEILDLLIDVSLGSPAVCALRAFHRIAPDLAWDEPAMLNASAEVALAFRTLFNQHDAVALLRHDTDDRYWRRVLTYAAEGNLQSVLDELAHYLVDAEGLASCPSSERIAGVARAMSEALSVRPSQIEVDNPVVAQDKLVMRRFQMRGRFAMRLAEYRDEEGTTTRLGLVRDAFNSPFRPFVLATTSVGQEGLDFHPYCYRVYHWNLPGNPVDLEQREGRIHRYKGHAIRLNIAHRQAAVGRGSQGASGDPWEEMFKSARAEAEIDNDLIPYWIYEGPVKVERRIPLLPFSREVKRLEWLKRSLTVYRLAFGQPRQDDLLEYLQSLLGREMTQEEMADLQINLEPPQQPQAAT
jgi:hypothetical protein